MNNPARAPRPKPSTESQLSSLLDKQLLDWVKNGVPYVDEKTGEEKRRPLRAGDAAVVIKRLAQLGIGPAEPDEDPTLNEIRKELKKRGPFKFPTAQDVEDE